jgi:hypothetical protein
MKKWDDPGSPWREQRPRSGDLGVVMDIVEALEAKVKELQQQRAEVKDIVSGIGMDASGPLSVKGKKRGEGWSPEQRKAFGEKMKARREAKARGE